MSRKETASPRHMRVWESAGWPSGSWPVRFRKEGLGGAATPSPTVEGPVSALKRIAVYDPMRISGPPRRERASAKEVAYDFGYTGRARGPLRPPPAGDIGFQCRDSRRIRRVGGSEFRVRRPALLRHQPPQGDGFGRRVACPLQVIDA